MEYTTTNTASMEGDTTDTGLSMPSHHFLNQTRGLKVQPVTSKKSVTTTVTAILAYMNHLMKTMDTIKELIKTLPKELY